MKLKNNRLKYEYEDLIKYEQFSSKIDKENPDIWIISFQGAKNTLYEKEKFNLKFEFNDRYVRKFF